MINFSKYKNIYLYFSGLLILTALAFLIIFGLRPGIEFQGGSVLEISFKEDIPSLQEVDGALSELNLGEYYLQRVEGDNFLIRTTRTDEDLQRKIMDSLEGAEQEYFESIGPVVGGELRRSSILAIFLASLAVILYIAFTFSGTTGRLSSWHYGLVTAGVGFSDVFIILGVFSLLGYLFEVQLTIPVTVALLTTLGYSINDTVVVLDRIRENMQKMKGSFQEIVDVSLNQTLTRSINTSLTTILVLLSLLFLGGETLYYFVLALIMGVIIGTYSSIFLASSLILKWVERLTR